MTWQILIHPLVLKEDLPELDSSTQRKILKAVRKKLAVAPEQYGEPLRGGFSGYWKLRVGDFRVVYKIKREKILVKVIKISARRNFEVYEALVKRIPQILD